MDIYTYYRTKAGSVLSDSLTELAIKTLPSTLAKNLIIAQKHPLPTISTLAALEGADHVGGFKGMLDDDLTDALNADKSTLKGLIPGVAKYRNTRRQRAVEHKLSKRKNKDLKTLSEIFGSVTAPMATSKALEQVVRFGGVPGIVAGLLGTKAMKYAPNVGFLLSQITPSRSEADQIKYYDKSDWGNWLLPGVAEYNRAKTLGVADRIEKALKGKKK